MQYQHPQQQAAKPGFSIEEIEKAPRTVLASDTSKALDQVSSFMSKLCDFYTRENAVLRKADTQSFINLQSEKMILARNYQAVIEQMRERHDEIKNAPESKRVKVQEHQDIFQKLADENKDLLGKLEKGTERLRSRIVETVKTVAERKRVNSYSNSGHLMTNPRRPLSTGLEETA